MDKEGTKRAWISECFFEGHTELPSLTVVQSVYVFVSLGRANTLPAWHLAAVPTGQILFLSATFTLFIIANIRSCT